MIIALLYGLEGLFERDHARRWDRQLWFET